MSQGPSVYWLRRAACSLIVCSMGLAACAPPPLPVADDTDTQDEDTGEEEEALPTVEFVFPHNNLVGTVCAEFFVAVDIDNIELVDFKTNTDNVDGQGHWHLVDDITGDYYALPVPYGSISADLNGNETRNYQLTATLNDNDHTPLNPAEFPDSIAQVEFTVSNADDCLGGAGGMDSGSY